MTGEVINILNTRWRVKLGDENCIPKLELLVTNRNSGNSWILLANFPSDKSSQGMDKMFLKQIQKVFLKRPI